MQLDHIPGINSSAQNSDLDEANINVEIEQGRGSGGGQEGPLKQSAPLIHVSYVG